MSRMENERVQCMSTLSMRISSLVVPIKSLCMAEVGGRFAPIGFSSGPATACLLAGPWLWLSCWDFEPLFARRGSSWWSCDGEHALWGGRCAWSVGRKRDRQTFSRQYASAGDGRAHPSVQTFFRSPPSYSWMASRLQVQTKYTVRGMLLTFQLLYKQNGSLSYPTSKPDSALPVWVLRCAFRWELLK